MYPSTAEAVDAAVAAVETAAVSNFEGTQAELDDLLIEGLKPVEADEAFWKRLTGETDQMVEGRERKPVRG